MIEVLEAAFLGFIQGLTEFLPVSSSGHLEIAKYVFGENEVAQESLMMTVVLHFATALSTVVVFYKDILLLIKGAFAKGTNQEKKFIGYVILSLIPAGLLGVLAEEIITDLFSDNLTLVSCMLLVTALLLFFADRVFDHKNSLSPLKSILIGVAQAIAIIPGISRSGATISTALLLKIDRSQAARFSFLMVLPLIFGKILLDVVDGDFTQYKGGYDQLIVGFLTAFFTGIVACKWMISIVKKAKLKYFAFYCALVGIIGCIYAYGF